MGLDMYAWITRETIDEPVDFEQPSEPGELHYWRKHPNLHGWMEELYYAKGGTAASFNCLPVILGSEDLDRLEADVQDNRLPQTEGFFFGASDGSERDDDLAFIARARTAIAAGYTVYYTAWW